MIAWITALALAGEARWDLDNPDGTGIVMWVASDGVNLRAAPSTQGEVKAELPLGAEVTRLGTDREETIGPRTAPWVKVKTDAGEGYVWGGTLTGARAETDLDGDGVRERVTLSFRSDHHQIVRLAEAGSPPVELDLGVDGDIDGPPSIMQLEVAGPEVAGMPLLKVHLPGREMCGSGTTTYWVSLHEGKLRKAASASTWGDAPYWSSRVLTFHPERKTATLVEANGGDEDAQGNEIKTEKTTELVWRDGTFVPAR